MPEPIPVDLLDVIAFVRVVETGSIANAAARLGIAKSIVSRRVSRLEAVLGAQLLTRTPRGTRLTDIGREYHAHAAAGLSQLEWRRRSSASRPARFLASCEFRFQPPLASICWRRYWRNSRFSIRLSSSMFALPIVRWTWSPRRMILRSGPAPFRIRSHHPQVRQGSLGSGSQPGLS